MSYLVTISISVSSDFRIHKHGGYFVDVRDGGPRGRQMTTRNPGTYKEALKFIEQVQAAPKHGKDIEFKIIDRVPEDMR